MLEYISPLPGDRYRNEWPRRLCILGSTGSIGRSALEVVRLQRERFHIAALAGGRNIALLARQAAEFRPACLGLRDEGDIKKLRSLLPSGYTPEIVCGQGGYQSLARLEGVSTVLSAQSGAAGLRATFAAVEAGKVVALANKESLVLAGGLIRKVCADSGACILPVDSEHNALFQCLAGILFQAGGKDEEAASAAVSRLTLTASGGPFFGKTREELAAVTVEKALAHPNWDMGAKITIDSATLMNKGLEIMEAGHLFGLPCEAVDVLVHRESIVHSLVEFADGGQLAQLGNPDMRVPIAYCLAWPERIRTGVPRLDLAAAGSLSFDRPDGDVFPCLGLARRAMQEERGAPVVLNAANEAAVDAFLGRRLSFPGIADTVGRCLESYLAGKFTGYGQPRPPRNLEDIYGLDAETRACADAYLKALHI